MIKPKSHQIKPINYMKNNYGIILYHSTGSGKTITSLMALYQFDQDIIIIGPKSSKKAFHDEIKKLEYDKDRFSFYTYQKIKNILNEKIEFLSGKSVIIDEAHHLRSETKDNLFIASGLLMAHKVILLTATPIINYLNDIAVLVNIVKKRDVLPTERRLFNFFYFDERKLTIQNENMLQEKFQNCISYYEKKNDENYPKHSTTVKEVVMTRAQLEEYSKYIIKIIYENEQPRNKNLIELFNIEKDFIKPRKKNAFLTATRQISNTIDGDIDSPKVEQMVKTIIKVNKWPVVIYSNFLKNGIYPIANLLDKKAIKYMTITGNTSADKVVKVVDCYNRRQIDVLLLSSAGSESLDLKNTRHIHIMEPHWNEAKIRQVVGRTIRYKSHNSLPKKDRHVEIYRWVSKFPPVYTNMSADEYLISVSEKKDKIFKKFKHIIVESSIENKKMGGYYKKYIIYKRKYLDLKKKNKFINNKKVDKGLN